MNLNSNNEIANSNSGFFANAQNDEIMENSTSQTINQNQPNKIYFDYNNDGFKENMLSWFNTNEAILINDINNNGIVDNGSEILGNGYTDKFTNLNLLVA